MQELCNKEWKGNVRELMNVLERLIVTSSSNKITKEHLQSMNKKQKGPAVFQENSKSLTELIEDYEKTILQEAYNKHKTTVKIAEKLGTSQPTVARKLKKYKIN
ncbi:TyrR/PhhR family helix-turn-helix DNA-binding protein [Thalassobacillus sp. C254]|uniref:TyrR/PhhR family helix-turn-helix DNA-binding protein n=1 Tax=Thalassobacillus sp. C254 TaxID=1225341 RepID=UPI00277D0A9D|nr:TyrR/PhhR family helix-turn-helix DNA-binding protein [Thalassobacillus sp. C254]